MKIAFDAQLIFEKNKTGVGKTAEYIIKAMSNIKENEYRLNYFGSKRNMEQNKMLEEYKELGYNDFKCTSRFQNLIYRIMRRFFEAPYALFFGGGSDVTVFFNYFVPPMVRGKSVVIVYDMTYKAFPQTMDKTTKRLLDKKLLKSCERADKIITISQFSKSEIIKYLGIDEKKIDILPSGVDLSIFNDKTDKAEIEKVKSKFNIDGEYFLYLGTLEPRKNLERLIEAYYLLKKENNAVPKLVMAGKKGWLYDKMFEDVKKYKLENDVIFTGYAADDEIVPMISGAVAFVFVSVYEGFGIPPLEAMACGTPVIVSGEASLPEVVGDAGITADAFDCEDIKNAMKKIWEDSSLREELSARGKARAEKFTWESSAETLNEILKSL